ncbi:transmembrane protein 141 isoform X2 [Camarhynchus parvulus]|uniref:transmembrane protein 141 isoform X2 n=1 Tax=Geospiza parvula TaxID=87175 RepID=UPI001237BD78|nr:transmembrane protein 141 isoform X2 [Camarhynchus parvulus]
MKRPRRFLHGRGGRGGWQGRILARAGPGSLAMVNLGVRRVEDDVAAKYPALQQYAACQSHAFLKGIGTFLAGTGRSSHPGIPRAVLGRSAGAARTSRPCPVTPASVLAGSVAAFAVQKMARQKLPYSLQWSLLLAAAAGSLGSYVVTRAETQKCSNFWIYLETENLPSAEDRDGAATLVRRNRYGDVVE